MTYNPKRNGYAEIIYGNGNRISNSTVADIINYEHGDTLDFSNTDIDKFDDNFLRVFNNIMVFDWFDVESGIVIHRRRAANRDIMRKYEMPEEYRSFAPMLGLKFSPWLQRGPMFTINYERGIKGVNKSNIDYERWEFDASWKKHIPGLRVLNLRLGGGFYTNKEDKYFLDYTNFRNNNLPGSTAGSTTSRTTTYEAMSPTSRPCCSPPGYPTSASTSRRSASTSAPSTWSIRAPTSSSATASPTATSPSASSPASTISAIRKSESDSTLNFLNDGKTPFSL